MSLKLYYHPLASFCWKPLIALYENATPFEKVLVDLGDAKARASFYEIWPIGQFPVLVDTSFDKLIPASSAIVEYLNLAHPGPVPLIPDDAWFAMEARRWDRFLDDYVHVPMQKIVGDVLRKEGESDAIGVAEARAMIAKAYGVLEVEIGDRWMLSEKFTMADCAAAPALFYANKVAPFKDEFPKLKAYLARLETRASFARVLHEAEPFFQYFPYKGES